jgi:hypothetical protein
MHRPDLNRQFQSMFRYPKFLRFRFHLHLLVLLRLLGLLPQVPPLVLEPLRALPLVLQPSLEE